MKATLYVVEDPALMQNGIFFNESFYGMKNSGFMFLALRQALEPYGIELNTQDINPPEDSAFVIGVDMSQQFQQANWPGVQKKYLVLSEPATYYPHNWDLAAHTVFDKVFTYNQRLVDNKKYFHYNFAIDLTENDQFYPVTETEFQQRKLCSLVAASFGVARPRAGSSSLLHERYLTLKWFAENHPEDFSLYSRGIHPRTFESFRGISLIQRLLPSALASKITAAVAAKHKRLFDGINSGPIAHDGKITTLRNFRFNIAYENTGDLPGYLTEKLFDSLVACCVPVYWGDPDVKLSVPDKCFVDRRDFKSNAELYRYLKGVQYPEYAQYAAAITTFVQSVQRNQFGAEANAWRIAEPILRDMGIANLPATLSI